jgi:hypothetical protein
VGVKIIKLFDANPGSRMETVRIRDQEREKIRYGISIPYPQKDECYLYFFVFAICTVLYIYKLCMITIRNKRFGGSWLKRQCSAPAHRSAFIWLSLIRECVCESRNMNMLRTRNRIPFWPLVPFLILYPGWVKIQDPDPGWTTRIIFPRA